MVSEGLPLTGLDPSSTAPHLPPKGDDQSSSSSLPQQFSGITLPSPLTMESLLQVLAGLHLLPPPAASPQPSPAASTPSRGINPQPALMTPRRAAPIPAFPSGRPQPHTSLLASPFAASPPLPGFPPAAPAVPAAAAPPVPPAAGGRHIPAAASSQPTSQPSPFVPSVGNSFQPVLGSATVTPTNLITLNGASITSDKLTETNFREWYSRWRTHLHGYGLSSFVLHPPSYDDLVNSMWLSQDQLLCGALLSTISSSVFANISD